MVEECGNIFVQVSKSADPLNGLSIGEDIVGT